MLPTQVGAFEASRLRELSERPNTTVLTVDHTQTHEPWTVARLRPMMERLATRVAGFDASIDDFRVRKACLEGDEEVLAFQRQHPKLYWLLTDRSMVREKRFREAVAAMLAVRERVERGEVEGGRDADAMATRAIVAALQQEV